MINYRVGELDQRITIKREQLASDSMGGSEVALVDVGDMWCHVRFKSGRETQDADRLAAETRYIFVIRWRGDLLANDRIVWSGSSYNIRAINQMGGRKLYLELEADGGVAL